jgi:hypothetical protein
MFATKLDHYSMVLGIPWLKKHNPAIRFASNTIIFDSDFCLENYQDSSTLIKGITSSIFEIPTPIILDSYIKLPNLPEFHSLIIISATTFLSLAKKI